MVQRTWITKDIGQGNGKARGQPGSGKKPCGGRCGGSGGTHVKQLSNGTGAVASESAEQSPRIVQMTAASATNSGHGLTAAELLPIVRDLLKQSNITMTDAQLLALITGAQQLANAISGGTGVTTGTVRG